MFFKYPQDFRERDLAPGVFVRLVWGERVMLSHVTFQPRSTVPIHSHPHEQTGMVLDGELDMTVGGETFHCGPRDAFTIPGGVEHSASSCEVVTTVLDTFSPPREDYM
jgi:quercetin dioxygenase-like cupin family protein